MVRNAIVCYIVQDPTKVHKASKNPAAPKLPILCAHCKGLTAFVDALNMNSLDVFLTVSERELDDLIREVGKCASLLRLQPIVPSLDNAPPPRFTAEDHMLVCTDVHDAFKQMLLAMDFAHEKMEVRLYSHGQHASLAYIHMQLSVKA
jgi:hypothetical protein